MLSWCDAQSCCSRPLLSWVRSENPQRTFGVLPAGNSFVHQLALCLLGKVLELELDSSLGEHRILGAEIGGQFVDDVAVASRLQLGLDDSLSIGFGGFAEKAQSL